MSTERDDNIGAWVYTAIGWFAHNTVAANLLMVIVLVAGFAGLASVKQEIFPEFTLDVVTVGVPYPGASPTDVEQGIVLAVEEAVRGIDGVKRVTSTAQEGGAAVSVELILGTDGNKALQDIKAAVDRVTSFPEEAEKANVVLASRKRSVVSLIITAEGHEDLDALHAVAEDARARMLERDDITQVDLFGVPPLEVAIEVDRSTLEAHGLTLDDVARAVGVASLELPAGGLDTRGGELLVRVDDRRVQRDGFEDIVVRSASSGAELRLGQIATVTDGYEDNDLSFWYDGHRAVQLTAYRVGNETPQNVADAIYEIRDELRADLPANIELSVWDDDSQMLRDRIDLLVRNARMGLVLVLLVLAAFLNLRLAFWVALGIPISFMGAFALMPALDISVNMVSLFGLIVTLGMVVDDAIIVGENIYEKEVNGMDPGDAAVEGAREMASPVTFAILTTVAAFSPMLSVPGVMGKIFRILPLVVIAVLVFSLVESFFVLPAHLAHKPDPARQSRIRRYLGSLYIWEFIALVQGKIANALAWFIERIYSPGVGSLIRYRYITIAGAIAMFAWSVGMVASGMLPFSFFPKLEGNVVKASARLPYGTPIEQTAQVREVLEATAMVAIDQHGGDAIFTGMFTKLGQGASTGGPGGGPGTTGSHLVSVEIELVGSELREVSSKQIGDTWSELTPEIAGVEALSFVSSSGPGAGAAVAVQLIHRDTDVLAAASTELTETLRSYPALTDISNGWASGKPQLDFHIKPEARSLGITTMDIARQVRSSFFGAEAVREQRGRNELKVMVRLPEGERVSEFDLEQLRIRTPTGAYVPLSQVATFDRSRAPTEIKREDGRRVVEVTAENAPGVKSSREVLASLDAEVYPDLKAKYPGLEITLVGEQRAQGEALGSLGRNALIAMFVMYALLAIPARSYLVPLVIMAAIPFGFVGAVGGHVLMQYELSIISMFGIVALAGVVVNDSLVLIDAAQNKRREGMTARAAIMWAGARRLRPILLTSLTTFFGLAPMMFEQSMQARFLVPMAISLGFGVLFATFVIVLVVPCLYMVVEDLRVFMGWPEEGKLLIGFGDVLGGLAK